MARISTLSDVGILDTFWLLELYKVPGHYSPSRTENVRVETAKFVATEGELFVTVPVLFELANHIAHVDDGTRRRTLAERLLKDIREAIDDDSPWTIVRVSSDILLRSHDILQLAQRFLSLSGPSYSFADISIIDLANEFRQFSSVVRILAFDEQLESYSD